MEKKFASKKVKTTLSLFLSVLMFIGTLNIGTVSLLASTVVFNEDYSTMSIGSSPSWTNGNGVVKEKDSVLTENYLELENVATTPSTYEVTLPEKLSNATVDMEISPYGTSSTKYTSFYLQFDNGQYLQFVLKSGAKETTGLSGIYVLPVSDSYVNASSSSDVSNAILSYSKTVDAQQNGFNKLTFEVEKVGENLLNIAVSNGTDEFGFTTAEISSNAQVEKMGFTFHSSSNTPKLKSLKVTGDTSSDVVPEENTVPSAPAISARAGDGKAIIAWNEVPNATNYILYVNGDTNGINVGNATSYTLTGLTNGVEYSFTVKAQNEVGLSAVSNEVKAIPSKTTNDDFSITGGIWFESLFVNWNDYPSASSYNVYYKKASASDSSYVKVDSELVRKDNVIGGYRADILGLLGDTTYTVKVVPVVNNNEVSASQTIDLTTKPYDRDGFAFDPNSPYGQTTGGYEQDGTVAKTTPIIYVTNENVNTGPFVIDGTTYNSLGEIFPAGRKSPVTGKLVIRFIGQIGDVEDGVTTTDCGVDGLTSEVSLDVKETTDKTFEGVGNDASFKGFGITSNKSSNIVIRNLSFNWFYEDAVSLKGPSTNNWVTNNTFNIGQDRGGDKSKGDGSTDTKDATTYFTISYNHYIKSAKCSLAGATTSEGFHVGTYHHNWYDHSSSRHPRVRAGSIHVYNNFFDNNSTYGSAAGHKSSLLIQNNYYENVKRPMIISQQGHALSSFTGTGNLGGSGSNTLSSDGGGAIRQSGNYMDDYTLSTFSEEYDTGDSKYDGLKWDATTLSNISYKNNMENAKDVKATVTEWAGTQPQLTTK